MMIDLCLDGSIKVLDVEACPFQDSISLNWSSKKEGPARKGTKPTWTDTDLNE
jgi:hypothetical protein